MNLSNPFSGYTFVLRSIVYVFVPAFSIWQYFRLRRGLHIFQLEGYKRRRFLDWCARNRGRSLFVRPMTSKKPLVMTGRAWRLLVVAEALSVAAVLVVPGIVHIWGGWPYDIAAWAAMTALVFFGISWVLVVVDWLLTPVQRAINRRYLRAARARLDEIAPVVVGITGSFGKTSTKFAIARLLGTEDEVLATPGSYNSPLGVCRAINEQLQPGHRFLVVEMGAYGPGEIAELCEFVKPRIGVLTSIGPAHLERFGSLDAIRKTKYEIVESLPEDGVAVMNVDDIEVRRLADATQGVTVIRYGLQAGGGPHVTARDIQTTHHGTTMTLVTPALKRSIDVHMRLLGRHAIGHVLAGVAVAIICGRELDDIADAIERLTPVQHRLQIVEGTAGITVIDDAYNSNPDGAAAALEVLAGMPGGRKIVVTPGMVELGDLQADSNAAFGRRAAAVADFLIVVAPVNRAALSAGAREAGTSAQVIEVDSLQEAQAALGTIVRPGDVVLFENDLPDQYEG